MCCALLLNNVHKKELFVPSVVKKKKGRRTKKTMLPIWGVQGCASLWSTVNGCLGEDGSRFLTSLYKKDFKL